jgi:hypothetical protein
MIRFLLLGGRWGPVPWQFLLALGLACLAAAGLFWALYGQRSTDPFLGAAEVAILGVTAVVLLTIGIRRRGRDGPPESPKRPDADRGGPPPRGPPRSS